MRLGHGLVDRERGVCAVRRQDLDRDLALEAGVLGAVDDPHAAVADFGQDGVRAEG